MTGPDMGFAHPRTREARTRWLRCHGPRPTATTRVVCLPHAGGAASFFSGWTRDLAPGVELWAVQYPGREDRLTEPGPESLEALASAVAEALNDRLDRPVVLFGHSLGAIVAYETARVLERSYGRPAGHLVVSGRRAPSDLVGGDLHLRPDASLVAELTRLGGTSEVLLSSRALRSVFLPAIRNDFRLAETYRHRPGPPLTCPVTAIIGTADTEVSHEQALLWGTHTEGRFALHELPGGHFYLLRQRQAVLSLLAACQPAA